jgi:hypothetical protein
LLLHGNHLRWRFSEPGSSGSPQRHCLPAEKSSPPARVAGARPQKAGASNNAALLAQFDADWAGLPRAEEDDKSDAAYETSLASDLAIFWC